MSTNMTEVRIIEATQPGTISFDLDGVLANFTRGFTRIGNRLFGTAIGDAPAQQTWMFEDFPELGLDAAMCGHPIKGGGIWGEVVKSPNFWANLDPFNPSAMFWIDAITNKVFITNRLGIAPKEQSEAFLSRWGVDDAKVIVASKKGPIAIEQNVTAHIDDFYPNCTDIQDALPNCFTSLLYTPYNKVHHDEWRARGGHISLSVDHFIVECEKRQLIRWSRPPVGITTQVPQLTLSDFEENPVTEYSRS